ncbi:hypothetical protein BKA93DRAFT_550558 [Sparassis latifolia]
MRGAAPPPHMLPTQKMSAPFVAYGLCARVHPPYLSPSLPICCFRMCTVSLPPFPYPLAVVAVTSPAYPSPYGRFALHPCTSSSAPYGYSCNVPRCCACATCSTSSRTVPTDVDVDTYLVPLRNILLWMERFVARVHPALELAPSIAKICIKHGVRCVCLSSPRIARRLVRIYTLAGAYYVPVPSLIVLRCSLSLAIRIVSLRPCLKLLTI